MAILEYLEETRPTSALLPTNAESRARVREICSLIGCDIQPVQNLAVLKGVMALVSESKKNATKMEWGKQWITRGLSAVEDLLKNTTSMYCVGEKVTLADLFLIPQVYNAKRFDVNISLFPRILNISEALQKLPEFQKAHPELIPDAV